MSVAQWFSDFCNQIRVKNVDSISYRYKRITKQLNVDFWKSDSRTSHSFYVGSYGRNTAIQGFSDLDMVFELPPDLYYSYTSYIGNGQSALLQAVRNSMRVTYPSSNIGGDGQVVVVRFDDGLKFEVLPVFVNKMGTYTFPDSNKGGSWKTTNPKAEIRAIRERNASCNRNLVPLCRMMRAWRQKWSVPITGMLIETLAYRFIEKYEHRDKSFLYYDFMCRDFFLWMGQQDVNQEYWHAPGSGTRVYGKGLFQHKAKRCYNIACDAIANEIAKPSREWSAKQNWREVFGSSFPN
jgi:hypothetical protein